MPGLPAPPPAVELAPQASEPGERGSGLKRVALAALLVGLGLAAYLGLLPGLSPGGGQDDADEGRDLGVPAALTAAIDSVDRAIRAAAFPDGCETLTNEMTAFQNAGVPIRTQADLHQLTMEVAAFCAQIEPAGLDGTLSVDAARWSDLRGRLVRVLAGKNPQPGPRYQIDMPGEVAAAIRAVDQAFEDGNLESVRTSLGSAQGPIALWADKMPGPRGARMMMVAEEDLTRLSSNLALPDPDLGSARAEWERAKRRMQPGGEEP